MTTGTHQTADDLRLDFEQLVAASPYLVLATADDSGVPWATPVWFATADCRTFYWVSRPDARHSVNLAARPELCITIFDSGQQPGTGRGAYLAALGEEVPDDELERGLATFAERAQSAGAGSWTLADVTGSARLRLYRARAVERFVLSDRDERIVVPEV